MEVNQPRSSREKLEIYFYVLMEFVRTISSLNLIGTEMHLKSMVILLLISSMLLSSCAPGYTESSECTANGDTVQPLSEDKAMVFNKNSMNNRLIAILNGTVTLPKPEPGSVEQIIKESADRASIVLYLGYSDGTGTVGSGTVVSNTNVGLVILTNRHVLDHSGTAGGGISLDVIRVARSIHDLNDSGAAMAINAMGYEVRAIISDIDDSAAIKIFNPYNKFDDKFKYFSFLEVNAGYVVEQDKPMWYVASPIAFTEAMIDRDLGLGRIFDRMLADGCVISGPDGKYARTDSPSQQGMSGTGLVDDEKGSVVALITMSTAYRSRDGEVRSHALVLDLVNTEGLVSAARALTLTNQNEKMTFPVPTFGE